MTDRSLKLISLYWLNCTTDEQVENEVAKIYENRYNDTYNKVISKIFTK